MFESEQAEIQVLSNVADAQGLGYARDLLRKAAYEFKKHSEFLNELSNFKPQEKAESR